MRSFPKTVHGLPKGEFYAILKPTSVTITGDERSRTNPGHGYPEHTETNWSIEVYATKAEWFAEIEKLESVKGHGRQEFKAAIIRPVAVTSKVIVDVEEPPPCPNR